MVTSDEKLALSRPVTGWTRWLCRPIKPMMQGKELVTRRLLKRRGVAPSSRNGFRSTGSDW